MAQKWLKAIFHPLFKIEVVSKIFGEGDSSIKISDKDGKIIYQDTVTSRGHTVYYFTRKMVDYSGKYSSYTFELKSKTSYDSYGQGNTSPITEVLTDFATNDTDKDTYGGNLIVVVTYDAITNDSDFSTILKKDNSDGFQLSKNVNITCSQARNSFAFVGIDKNSNGKYRKDCEFEYNMGKSSSLTAYILPSEDSNKIFNPIYSGMIHFYTLCRKLDCYTRIYPYNDSSIRIGIPYATHNTAIYDLEIPLTNATLYTGRTYYIKVRFRTRGDGNSTPSKCSSIGFITYWNDWASLMSYIHNSATAYSEIGKVVEWTYSFTVDSDVTPTGTNLYFIIDNGWACGNDAQTIDLYYAKYWDSEGNVYSELSPYKTSSGYKYESHFLEVKKDSELYYTSNIGEYNYKGKYRITNYARKSDIHSKTCLHDTLERLTYNDMKKLRYDHKSYTNDQLSFERLNFYVY